MKIYDKPTTVSNNSGDPVPPTPATRKSSADTNGSSPQNVAKNALSSSYEITVTPAPIDGRVSPIPQEAEKLNIHNARLGRFATTNRLSTCSSPSESDGRPSISRQRVSSALSHDPNLRRLSVAMGRCSSPIFLRNMSTSANTVSKLDGQFYVDADEALEKASTTIGLEKNLDAVGLFLRQAAIEAKKEVKLEENERILENVLDKVIERLVTVKIKADGKITPPELRNKLAIKAQKNRRAKLDSDDLKESLSKLLSGAKEKDSVAPHAEKLDTLKDALLKTIEDGAKQIDSTFNLDGLPVYFKKAQILEKLGNETPQNQRQELETFEGDHLSAEQLKSIIGDELTNTSLEGVSRYYSSVEILASNENRPFVRENLKSMAYEDVPVFWVKSPDGEGKKEDLLQNLIQTGLKSVSFADAIAPKGIEELNGAEFEGQINPKLLVSLDVGRESIDQSIWKQWIETKHEFEVTKAKGEKITPELEDKYDKALTALNSLPINTSSIAKNVLFDLMMNPTDNHLKQYIINGSNNLINIDYGRWGAPEIVRTPNGDHYAFARFALYDHPISEAIIEDDVDNNLPELIAEFIKINADEVEKNWNESGLIADMSVYKDQLNQIKLLKEDAGFVKQADEEKDRAKLLKLAAQYEINNENSSNLVNDIIDQINKKYATLKEANWDKIHPDTVAEFKQRVKNLQNYFQNANIKHTLKEAFYVAQPNVAPFMKAAALLEANPGNSLWISQKNRNDNRPISIEKIMAEYASKFPNDETLISDMKEIIAKGDKLGVISQEAALRDPGVVV